MSNLHLKRDLAPPLFQHASAEEYATFVRTFTALQSYADPGRNVTRLLRCRKDFVKCYPDLRDWFSAPLTERIGRVFQEDFNHPHCLISYQARHYLIFLAFQRYIELDWDYLIALHHLKLLRFLPLVGATLTPLVETAVKLGYEKKDVQMTLQWSLYRLLLHLGTPETSNIRAEHLAEFGKALNHFENRSDIALFFGSQQRYQQKIKLEHQNSIGLLQTVLYHLGQVDTEPPGITLRRPAFRSPVSPQMEAVVERYVKVRSLTNQPSTTVKTKRYLLHFVDWVAQTYSQIKSWTEITREQVLEYAEALNSLPCSRGRPYAAQSKYGLLVSLLMFFEDTIHWEWEEVPTRPPLRHGDLPKLAKGLPRYIPQEELDQLMPVIRALDCPYQRTALLIARWSGARREEIQRLAVDCLDSYPDGTPRLRIPAGKTKKERMVPLNEEAAASIRLLKAQREGGRGLRDRLTGLETRYLFMRHGRLISTSYLFEKSLNKACNKAGLVTSDQKALVTAHRFRHTVGTQLAQGGARLRTIQKILGHESAEMSLVYIGLTDEDVKQDYQKVLGVNALIAGPGAEKIHCGEFTEAELNWLKTNFFKTELELGHCLRLPQEGPCQCDLYLNCAKFVTSSEYVPRLRQRRSLELELLQDAHARGWMREVERHHCTLKRLDQLLAELGEEPEKTE